jgi:hypothetical protein
VPSPPNIEHRFAVRVLFGVATAIETPSSLTLPCPAFGVDDRRRHGALVLLLAANHHACGPFDRLDRRGEVRLRPEFIDHDFPQPCDRIGDFR